MADILEMYDKEPIIGFIHIRKWKFGLREIILGVIALLLLLICFILSGLFNKVSNELGASTSQAYLDERMCVDIGCMETATRAMELRNKSVDPCENFYEYACGNYQNVAPVYLDRDSMKIIRYRWESPLSEISPPFTRSVLEDLTRQNEDRMMDLLDSPISDAHDASYERKLKQYFQACNNMFDRDTKRGAPLLKKIISELGGWKLLGNWKQDWNFNDALKKVQADLGVEALYSIHVFKGSSHSNTFNIEIYHSGTSWHMPPKAYTNPNAKQHLQAYMKFIRKVGSLLVNDAITLNITQDNGTTESDLDEFVNDTFTIESYLASAMSPYPDFFQMNLTAINAEAHGLIDWTEQLSYYFNTTNITGATEVNLFPRFFFRDIMSVLKSLPVQNLPRMLHNYLIWRVAESYGFELSWDYIQSFKEFLVHLEATAVHLDARYSCITKAERLLEDALSALYVRHFFNEENKRTVHEITDNIKLALQSQLEKTPWMDATTKQYAKDKLDKTIFKMGYPDWMKNQSKVDLMYSDLTVTALDHFDNLISINRFRVRRRRYEFNNLSVWSDDSYSQIFETNIESQFHGNEVHASAGVLQYPIYSNKQPHYANFGSLGAILGRFIHGMIGDIGRDYDKNGTPLPSTWWSDATLTAYNATRRCFSQIYNDVTLNKDKNFENDDTVFIAWTNGVRLALIGYKDWVKSRGIVEKVLPGTGLTNEQMIFLAHAQTFFYVKENLPDWVRMYRNENDVMVNMVLSQLKEFSKAFNCKPGAKMNHKVKCDYY